jgi:hypothetical protein
MLFYTIEKLIFIIKNKYEINLFELTRLYNKSIVIL